MSKRRKRSLANIPVEGRLDVLCYKVVERIAKAAEVKYKMPGLWKALERDVESGIRQVIASEKVPEIPSIARVLLERFGGQGAN